MILKLESLVRSLVHSQNPIQNTMPSNVGEVWWLNEKRQDLFDQK